MDELKGRKERRSDQGQRQYCREEIDRMGRTIVRRMLIAAARRRATAIKAVKRGQSVAPVVSNAVPAPEASPDD